MSCMKQIASLKADMSLSTVVLSISNSEYSFPLQQSGNAFSLPRLFRQITFQVHDIKNDVCRFSRNHVVECSERTVLS